MEAPNTQRRGLPRFLPVAPVVALVALATATATPASAATVACGRTITANTVLKANVGPCAGDGIVIGADNITVDLGGHRVFGDGSHSDHVGIHLRGRRGVTVRGGTVTGFATGVAIEGGSHNTVSGMVAHDNIGALDQSGNFGDGVGIFNSSDNVVIASVVRHNGPFEGIGVFGNGVPTLCEDPPPDPLGGPLSPDDLALVCNAVGIGHNPNPTQRNRIQNNVVADNNINHTLGAPDQLLSEDIGVNLGVGLAGGSHTTIVNNTITGNGLDGIDACSIKGNPCFTDFNVIKGNYVSDNGYTNLTSNVVRELGVGVPVFGFVEDVFDFGHEDFRFPTHDVIAANTIVANASTGLYVGNPGNRILNNVVTGNAVAESSGPDKVDFYLNTIDLPGQGDCSSGNVIHGNTFGTVTLSFPRTVRCLLAAGNRVLEPAPASSSAPAKNGPSGQPAATRQRHSPA